AEIATLRQQLPHANMMHVGSFVLQTSDDYTNAAKARIVYTSNNTDTFVSEMIWDEQTKTLTLKRTNGMENLIQILSGIDGNDGREVELQKTTTHVQWRYVGDTVWNDLIPLTDIKGNQGDPGADGD